VWPGSSTVQQRFRPVAPRPGNGSDNVNLKSMFRSGALALAILAATPASFASPAFQFQMDYAALVEQQGPAVVHIAVRNPPRPNSGPSPTHGFGTGFFISADGYLLTNAHVVANALSLRVRLVDRREYPARLIGMDPVTDVAVLKIEAADLPTVRVARLESVRVGEPVGAIGSPFNYEHTITAGIVSAKNRNVDELFVPFIQTDTAINPGNSGGPLFNARGEVIGINSRIWGRTGAFAGMAFAIPIELALEVASQLRQTGTYSHGHVDIATQRVTPELALALGMHDTRGALVTDLGSSPAVFEAGLRVSDVILRAADREVEHPLDLARAASAMKPGVRLPVAILRDGVQYAVHLPVVAMAAKSKPVAAPPAPADSTSVMGLAVRPLSAEEQARMSGIRGLMVERVLENSPAAHAELRAGDVVLSAHGRHAVSLDQLGKGLRAEDPVALLVQRGSKRLFVALDPNAGR
jgi:serine protease Do